MSRSPLRIFFFTDWRIAELEVAEALLLETSPVDLIIYGGDDVDRFIPPLDFPERIIAKLRDRCERALRQRRSTEGRHPNLQWRAGDWPGDPQEFIDYAAKVVGSAPNYAPASKDGRWTVERVLRLFRPSGVSNWLSRMAQHATHGVGAVIGNDCFPEDRHILGAPGVRDLHRFPIQVNGWGVVGIEGSIVSRGRVNNELVNDIGHVLHHDARIKGHLAEALACVGTAPEDTVIVSHTPPRGSLDIGLRFGLDRLGSPALAAFIKRHQPHLVLCGHVHSQGGKVTNIAATTVVNAACDDTNVKRTRAAVIELTPKGFPRITWCDPKRYSVFCMPGVTHRQAQCLISNGITRPSGVLSADEATLRKAGFGPTRIARLRARQVLTHVWLRRRPPELPERFLFYDLETGLSLEGEPQLPWLIGAMVESKGHLKQWVASQRGQRAMLREFLEFAMDHPGSVLCSWSGNRFDARAVEDGLGEWYPRGKSVWRKLPKADLLVLIRPHLALPIDDWKLGSVAAYCGFLPDPEDTMDGFDVGLLYECFRRLGERLPVRRIRRRNANDVLRLAHVAKWFREQNQALKRDSVPNGPRRRARQGASPISRGGWGRGFARGVIRAYLDGRGDVDWMQACLKRSGVPESEVAQIMKEMRRMRT